MSLDYYVNISIYLSANDNVGRAIRLADFMMLGKTEYRDVIDQYRAFKAKIALQIEAREAYRKQIGLCDQLIAENENPLGGDDSEDVKNLRAERDNNKNAIAEIDKSIARLKRMANMMKVKLPCATLSGLFGAPRAKENLISHSGYICIDIDDHYVIYVDGKKRSVPQPLYGVPALLSSLPYVLYAAHSCGGVGYFALIPIGKVDEAHPHEWYFECLKHEFEQYGIMIDHACRDITRLRFVSYDDNPIRNPRAVPYIGATRFISANERKQIFEDQKARAEADIQRKSRENSNVDEDWNHAMICIEEIERRRLDYTDDYLTWVMIGFALASGFGEDGRTMFHRISSISSKYNASDADKKYDSCLKRQNPKISIRTLFSMFEHPEQYKEISFMQPLRWYEIVKNNRYK